MHKCPCHMLLPSLTLNIPNFELFLFRLSFPVCSCKEKSVIFKFIYIYIYMANAQMSMSHAAALTHLEY